jgi:zinc transport system permease protein
MIAEALGYEFFRNALIAGVLASIACGFIGSFIVVKRMVSLAGGISHAAFGGIGLGYYLGIDPILGATVFSLGTAGIISHFRNQAHQHLDTLVAGVWASGMALGILFIYLAPGFAPDLFSYLFGNILLVPFEYLMLMTLLVCIIVVTVTLFYHRFVAVTFDEEYAIVMNLPARGLMLTIIGLTALTVVMLIQVVGVILVIALLALPAAIAREYSSSMKAMILYATLLGALFTTSGIWLSYILDVPSGATIILIAAAAYFLVILGRDIRQHYSEMKE